jgi:hypothetical protein
VVAFCAASASAVSGVGASHHEVLANATARRGCASSVSVGVGPTNRNQRVRLTLRPTDTVPRWCTEPFSGRIVLIVRLGCQGPLLSACPAIGEPAPQTVAGYSFRVTA